MPLHSVLDAIGNSPCVTINNLCDKQVNLFAKLEFLNPGIGSNDRHIINLIENAESKKTLRPQTTIIAIADGTVELSLAMVCAQKQYPLKLVVSSPLSPRHNQILGLFNIDIVTWIADDEHASVSEFAQAQAEKNNWYFFSTEYLGSTNTLLHDATVFELVNTFSETHIDYFIRFKDNTFADQYFLQQVRKFSPHSKVIQVGINDNAANALNGVDLQNHNALSSVEVSTLQAENGMHKAVQSEGILTGIRGGAVLAAALALAEHAAANSTIVSILPDHLESYLHHEALTRKPSSAFFLDHLPTDETPVTQENEEHVALPMIEVNEEEPMFTDVTEEMLQQFINNPDRPVVMFGLEWCESCWAARTLFKRLAIPVHCVDLDSAAYSSFKLGHKIRAALTAHTDRTNLPQVFIRGEFIGDSLDLFDMVNSRALFRKLNQHHIPHNHVLNIDPYTLLPGWMRDHTE